LRYFGQATRATIIDTNQMHVPPALVDYRIDISRPGFQRTWLDGVVDLNVMAGQLYEQRHLVAHRKRRFGERYWNYHMPPSFQKTNLAWMLWPLRSYCWGAAGTLPWQTVGSDGDLVKADATALLYPGRKFGLDGPIPSLRMKAWREGIALTELLHMLRTREGWTDVQLRAYVGQVLALDGWRDGWDPTPDAPIVTFTGVDVAALARLREQLLADLAERAR
jgi:hypothetical protein